VIFREEYGKKGSDVHFLSHLNNRMKRFYRSSGVFWVKYASVLCSSRMVS